MATNVRAGIYIRQSANRDQDVALSEPIQRSKGMALAERDGVRPDNIRVFIDLGRSGGGGKESRRHGYQALLKAIERREIDVLYTLTVARLGRHAMELMRLAHLCHTNGVEIVSEKEGRYDGSNPMSKALFGMSAVFAELERDMAVQRQLDNVAARRLRGDKPAGPKPYHERPGNRIEEVIAAYKQAGTLVGAVRILNDADVPAPMGKAWSPTGTRLILNTAAPGLMPVTTVRGVKPASSGEFRFYRLLRCYCGKVMTAYTNKGKPAYRCHSAPFDKGHPRPYIVMERMLLPAFRDEMALVRLRAASVEVEVDAVASKVAVQEARRTRLTELYLEGEIAKPDYLAQKERITRRMTELTSESRAKAVVVPDIDSDAISPKTINAALRELFQYVELGPDLRPVRFEWTVPEMRLSVVASSQTA